MRGVVRSGIGFPEIIMLDNDKHVINHLKRAWSEGQQSRFGENQEEFVRITKERLTWGSRRKHNGIIADLFSIDRKSGAYTWLDSSGTEIAHGACELPDLTS